MLTKAWIAVLMGLLLGSLFFSSGCGWWGSDYSNNPYGAPCSCGAQHAVPVTGPAATGGTPGWRVPITSGATPAVGGAGTVNGPATTTTTP